MASAPGWGRAPRSRLRSFGSFLLAGIYAVLAHQFAIYAANVLTPGFFALGSRLLFLILILVGFSAMAAARERPTPPEAAIGLPRRAGRGREWALGAGLGWAGIAVCVLPVALTGGLLVSLAHGAPTRIAAQTGIALAILWAWTLTDELIFRGYPFQRLMEAVGPTFATILLSLLFAAARTGGFATATGGITALLLGFLLAMAYLRTRALWVGWGFHFAWNASTALLFGLPISGAARLSPVFSSYTSGPTWLTGGGNGPEGSVIAILVLLALFFVLSRTTRELRHRWAFPEVVGAGIPVDIDALSRKQHEQGMGPGTPAPQPLIQISPPEPPRHPEPPANGTGPRER